MLTEEIRKRVRKAMKAGDVVAKGIFRVALGEVQSEETRTGRSLDDEQVAAILRKLVKSNDEVLAVGPSDEQRTKIERENVLLGELLPQTLSEDEIIAALEPVLETVRAARSDGQATGIAMKHLRASGAVVTGRDVAGAVRALRS